MDSDRIVLITGAKGGLGSIVTPGLCTEDPSLPRVEQ